MTGKKDSRRNVIAVAVAALALLFCGTAAAEDPDSEAAPGDGTAHGEPTLTGSTTLRAMAREGKGNDRANARFSLEWRAGSLAGAFTVEADSGVLAGALWSRPGAGSFNLSDRWIAWQRGAGSRRLDLRLGHVHGLRFAEGLVLGAASFDGLSVDVQAGQRARFTVLAGRTDSIDPEEFYPFDPIRLFPRDDEPFLGTRGRLVGARAEFLPAPGVTTGVNLLAAVANGTPTARLASADVAWSHGRVDLAAEVARRDGGGGAGYLRADVPLGERLAIGVEHRLSRGFASPLANPPRYGGLSAADEQDETGWLLRLDAAATPRLLIAYSLDYSHSHSKLPGSGAAVLRHHRLEVSRQLGARTALGYGFEFEDAAGAPDGSLHSLLVTHAFPKGGRLSGRLAVDRATPGHRTTLRLGYRVPLLDRRFTLLLDDTLRFETGGVRHSISAGGSVRIGAAAFLTARVTAAAGEPDSIDVTWHRRF